MVLIVISHTLLKYGRTAICEAIYPAETLLQHWIMIYLMMTMNASTPCNISKKIILVRMCLSLFCKLCTAFEKLCSQLIGMNHYAIRDVYVGTLIYSQVKNIISIILENESMSEVAVIVGSFMTYVSGERNE